MSGVSAADSSQRVIPARAAQTALNSGLAGMVAQAVNVCALMWMRTIMICQYRHGGSVLGVSRKLWQEGGIRRFYRGIVPALIISPAFRFGDTAANDGMLAALEQTDLNIASKTMMASACAAGFRFFLLPIDAWENMKQVEGKDGLHKLIQKAKVHPTAFWQGAAGAISAAWLGHYVFFYTGNKLGASVPSFEFRYGENVRNAAIGFVAGAGADVCSNPIWVLKTMRQTSLRPASYMEMASEVVAHDGIVGLFGRGLQMRILMNGVQGAVFNVGWKAFANVFDSG